MHIVHAPLASFDENLPARLIRVERRKLAKTLWRGSAEDGTEFGFDLSKPLQPGETVLQSEVARYQIEQEPESCFEIDLALSPIDALHLGWALGNLHLQIEGKKRTLLAPEDLSVTRLLERLGVPYRQVNAVFRAGQFESGWQGVSLSGHSHRHQHGAEDNPGHEH